MYNSINELVGKTFDFVSNYDDEKLMFYDKEGKGYGFYHQQDCCESVMINDIIGDLNDLVGVPILVAEEVSNDEDTSGFESATWTFYKFATIKGYVTVRWLGTSNGYYSESVYFRKI